MYERINTKELIPILQEIEATMKRKGTWHVEPDDTRVPEPEPYAYKRGDHYHARGVREDVARMIEGAIKLTATPATDAAMRFVGSPRKLLVLAGRPATGKTVAVSRVIAMAPQESIKSRPLFVSAGDFLDAIYAQQPAGGWLGHVAGWDWRPVDARVAGLLAVDDLGAEPQHRSGHGQGELARLICDRVDNGLRTIITTNLTRKQVLARYGERLDSRVDRAGQYIELPR